MRTTPISIYVYRRHLQLYRFLNDTFIFVSLIRPSLKDQADKFGLSTSKAKKPYRVPKKNSFILSKRRDIDIHHLLLMQHDKGLFESLISSIISRVEAFLIECLEIAVSTHPGKLSVLMDDRQGVPLDVFLAGSTKEDILAEMVRLKAENLTYLPPAKYIERLEKVLSIELQDFVVKDFIEAKASRDIIVHGTGIINSTYLAKAGERARGKLQEQLSVDVKYFQHVVVTAKRLSGDIAHKVEEQFG
jgi:hypothetical protein